LLWSFVSRSRWLTTLGFRVFYRPLFCFLPTPPKSVLPTESVFIAQYCIQVPVANRLPHLDPYLSTILEFPFCSTVTPYLPLPLYLACQLGKYYRPSRSEPLNPPALVIRASLQFPLHRTGTVTETETEIESKPNRNQTQIFRIRIMADDVQQASPKTEPVYVPEKEDADTRAARRELKQSSISDQPAVTNDSPKTFKTKVESDAPADAEIDATADGDDNEDNLREQVSSPKKKRAHDQVDDDVPAQDIDATSIASTDSGKDRATRLEPEKKRHRDHESKDGETVSCAHTPPSRYGPCVNTVSLPSRHLVFFLR
jgi:hypothetical protein